LNNVELLESPDERRRTLQKVKELLPFIVDLNNEEKYTKLFYVFSWVINYLE
jgi:hypothetical protein